MQATFSKGKIQDMILVPGKRCSMLTDGKRSFSLTNWCFWTTVALRLCLISAICFWKWKAGNWIFGEIRSCRSARMVLIFMNRVYRSIYRVILWYFIKMCWTVMCFGIFGIVCLNAAVCWKWFKNVKANLRNYWRMLDFLMHHIFMRPITWAGFWIIMRYHMKSHVHCYC